MRNENFRLNKKNNLRIPVRLALASAVLAGSVCGSGAIASAKTPSVDSSTTRPVYRWKVTNYTDRSLTAGEFYKQESDRTSSVYFGQGTDQPWLVTGEEVDAMQPYDSWSMAKSYTWGRVCYNGSWWNLRRSDPRFGWTNVYIFAVDTGQGEKKLVANPDGGHKDIPMIMTDRCQ